jgi:glycosyltransferase involved in cell wall biosynthesis
MTTRAPIAAVVPAYRCAATVPGVVRGTLSHGLAVLVVDDGSGDDTAAAARAAGAEVVAHGHNLGKGSALVTGFRWALRRGASHVLTLDADGQHDPAEIPRLLALAPAADLVVGRRALDLAHMPALRIVGNRVSSAFVSLFLGAPLPDTQCGFRLYSRRLLLRLPLRGGRFETETELLMRAQRLGMTIRWAEVSTLYDGDRAGGSDAPIRGLISHFDTLGDTLRVMRVVLGSFAYPREDGAGRGAR